ncbi:septation protein SepH [Nocardioides flavescens]|uniref:DUF3071 domain-containing protein n=1 Tax=Nocardioides flavescens TaxID=2691959 RepID=A0A6L7EMM4_9ACTN|nr:septation protein SepH [Nocardioides flavescens]MXG88583.1 DUF3071 domain-containing protein [Nocardioides flavescens]
MSAEELPTPHPVAPRPTRTAGRHLTLLGLTADGRRLRLGDPHDASGAEFVVDVDARLRAALGVAPPAAPGPAASTSTSTPSTPSSTAEVRTTMESTLRPRDIQARIRAGETPEAVAQAAQTSVERIMPFAAPVLAEREHVADRAQRSSIRRPAGEATTTAARTLGDAVTAHLHSRNVDPDVVTWDAWRREDGRWALAGRYSVQGREGLAELTFDQPGNFVVLENDDARWLVGDAVAAAPAPAAAEAAADAPRRLTAVRTEDQDQDPDQLSLGDDVLGIVDTPVSSDSPVEAFLDDQQGADESELVEQAADAAASDPDPEPAPEPDPAHAEPPARRPVKKNRGRASVPSWDEIMFGGPGD